MLVRPKIHDETSVLYTVLRSMLYHGKKSSVAQSTFCIALIASVYKRERYFIQQLKTFHQILNASLAT